MKNRTQKDRRSRDEWTPVFWVYILHNMGEKLQISKYVYTFQRRLPMPERNMF